jgi:cytochrome d ubiquinol oxidase subunit II
MATFWFIVLAFSLTAYVILDGFDLGAGFVSLFIARSPEERRTVVAAIGPFWDGNEVWLLAAGGVLVMAFPKVYAVSFAGFYLPLMIVLWLLILRGIAIEFGPHMEAPLWRRFWEAVFGAASIALAIVYGAALGNLVRGVPLDSDGRFFLPLWGNPGVLDRYTVLVGLAAAAALAWHGALWVNLRVSGQLQQRSAAFARRALVPVLLLTILVTTATFRVQPLARVSPLALVSAIGILLAWNPRHELRAFLGSSLYLAGMLASAAWSLYPSLLPPNLTIHNTHAGDYALNVAVYWWLPAFAMTLAYFVFLYKRFSGKLP